MAKILTSSDMELSLLKSVEQKAMTPLDATALYYKHINGLASQGQISKQGGKAVLECFLKHAYEKAVKYWHDPIIVC